MRYTIVSKRYTVNLFAVLLLSTVAFKAMAAPLCVEVLKAPPTQEQISAMFEDLANMTLQADIEKSQGTGSLMLQVGVKNKTDEALRKLNISRTELKKELQQRLMKIQEKDLQKDSSRSERERREQEKAVVSQIPVSSMKYNLAQTIEVNFKVPTHITDFVYFRNEHILITHDHDMIYKFDFRTSDFQRTDRLSNILFSRDKSKIYAHTTDGSVTIYQSKDLKVLGSFKLTDPDLHGTTPMHTSPDGNSLVIARGDIQIYSLASGLVTHELKRKNNYGDYAVQFLDNNTVVFANSEIYGTWNLQTGSKKEYPYQVQNGGYPIISSSQYSSVMSFNHFLGQVDYVDFRAPEKYIQQSMPPFSDIKALNTGSAHFLIRSNNGTSGIYQQGEAPADFVFNYKPGAILKSIGISLDLKEITVLRSGSNKPNTTRLFIDIWEEVPE